MPEQPKPQEPKTEVFAVKLYDKNGKYEDAKFIYNYNLMNGRQRFFARTMAVAYEESFVRMPETPDAVRMFAKKDLYNYAMAALVRRLPKDYRDGDTIPPFPEFNPEEPEGLTLLDSLFGDDIDRLESCYENFRAMMGIPSFESIMLSQDLNKLVATSPLLQHQIETGVAASVSSSLMKPMCGFIEQMQSLMATVPKPTAPSSGSLPNSIRSQKTKS